MNLDSPGVVLSYEEDHRKKNKYIFIYIYIFHISINQFSTRDAKIWIIHPYQTRGTDGARTFLKSAGFITGFSSDPTANQVCLFMGYFLLQPSSKRWRSEVHQLLLYVGYICREKFVKNLQYSQYSYRFQRAGFFERGWGFLVFVYMRSVIFLLYHGIMRYIP